MGHLLYSYISQNPSNIQRNGPCSALSCAFNAQINNIKREWSSSKTRQCTDTKLKTYAVAAMHSGLLRLLLVENSASLLSSETNLSLHHHIFFTLCWATVYYSEKTQTRTSRQTSSVQTSFLPFVVRILVELSGGGDTPSTHLLPVQVKWLRQGQRAFAELNHEHYFLKISVQH